MAWFKVDDNLCLHPKTVAAGNAAMGLWVRAGSWSMQNLTDGWIPADVATMLGRPTEIRRLVEAGLWEAKTDGYAFHEWNPRQPSRVQVLAGREAERNRKVRARRRPDGDQS